MSRNVSGGGGGGSFSGTAVSARHEGRDVGVLSKVSEGQKVGGKVDELLLGKEGSEQRDFLLKKSRSLEERGVSAEGRKGGKTVAKEIDFPGVNFKE